MATEQLHKNRQNFIVPTTSAPKLSPKQVTALAELLVSGNVSLAAQTSGVSVRTVQLWLASKLFAAELGSRQHLLLDTVQSRCATLVHRSLDTLAASLSDPDSRIRVKSADTLLGRMVPVLQHVSVNRRLQAVERKLGLGDPEDVEL